MVKIIQTKMEELPMGALYLRNYFSLLTSQQIILIKHNKISQVNSQR